MKRIVLLIVLLLTLTLTGIWGKSKLDIVVHDLIVELLQDQLDLSCGGKLTIDNFKINLLNLTASARDGKIVLNGKEVLYFKKLKAGFNFKHIHKKIIYMTNLELIDGFSLGAGPKSPTYQFINELAKPIPPEKQRPGRWRLKLQGLEVVDSTVYEPIGKLLLTAEHANMKMVRDIHTHFDMNVSFEKLSATLKGKTWPLGDTKANLYIDDDNVTIRSIAINSTKPIVDGNLIFSLKSDDSVGGTLNIDLPTEVIGLSHWIDATLQGQGKVSGDLSDLHLDGELKNNPKRETIIHIADEELKPTSLQTKYKTLLHHKHYMAAATSIRTTGMTAKIVEPIQIEDDKFSGQLDLQIPELNIAGSNCKGADLSLTLSGDIDAIEAKVTGICDSFSMLGIEATQPRIEFNYLDGEMAISLDAPTLNVKAFLHETKNNAILDEVTLTLNDYQVEKNISATGFFSFNNEQDEDAKFSTKGLNGSGKLIIKTATALPELSTTLTLKNDVLTTKIQTSDNKINADAIIQLNKSLDSNLKLFLKNFDISTISQKAPKSELDLALNYSFKPSDILTGNGNIELSKLRLGVSPHTLNVLKSKTLPIKNGALITDGLSLIGNNTSAKIRGTISLKDGFDLTVNVTAYLELLQNMLGNVDKLSGLFDSTIKVKGELFNPEISGSAEVKDSEIVIESANINVYNITGQANFNEKSFEFFGLKGQINSGTINVNGLLNLENLQNSKLSLEIDNFDFEPFKDSSLSLSADLELSQIENKPTLKGRIIINEAEILQSLSLKTLLRATTKYLFEKDHKKQLFDGPDIGLNVQLDVPRGFVIHSNITRAELKGKLSLRGTTSEPQLRGIAQVISGWVAFRDHYFDITSGRITFKRSSAEGSIDVMAETSIFSNTGNVNTIFLEANGPLSEPHIRLTSDNNLTQAEILSLLTASPTTIKPDMRQGTKLDSISILPEDSEGLLGVLNSLTRIDSLSVEPTNDAKSGTMQPALVARKDLYERLYLVGETILNGSTQNANLKLNYLFSPFITLMGVLNGASEEKNTSLEANAVFTILSKRTRGAEINFHGNDTIAQRHLFRALHLNPETRFQIGELNDLIEKIQDYYIDNGFPDVEVNVDSKDKDGYLTKIDFFINEGTPEIISSVSFSGDEVPHDIFPDVSDLIGTRPTKDLLEQFAASGLKKLRDQGFLSSNIRVHYNKASGNVDIKINRGDLIHISIKGNKAFSSKELLESVNIYKRKLPFAPNSIKIIANDIKTLYQQAGYAHADISWSKTTAPNSTNYFIEIREGSKLKIDRVNIQSPLDIDFIKSAFDKRELNSKLLLHPENAVESELENNASVLADILRENGWPNAKVEYKIEENPLSNSINISYIAEEGSGKVLEKIEVIGWPENINRSKEPELPCSLITAEEYGHALMEELFANGYLQANVGIEYPPVNPNHENSVIGRYTINLNQLTVIDRIKVRGNDKIDTDFILSKLGIKVGDPWSINKLRESRKRLLKLGLFSNIEYSMMGRIGDEKQGLLVTVKERNLQNLELGVGANSELGFHLFGEALDRSFFKDGRTFSLRGDIYYDPAKDDIGQGIANLRYSHPNVFNSKYLFTNDLRFQRLSLSTLEFDVDRVLLNAALSDSSQTKLSHSFSYSLIAEDLDSVPSDATLSSLDNGTHLWSLTSAGISYDLRDNPINPRHGYMFNLDSTLSSKTIASEANYFALQGRASTIKRFGLSPFGFADNFRIGSAWTYGDTKAVPISQRYYLGGRNSVRGFRENSLGPRGENGSVIGGDFLLLNNFELQYDLNDTVELITFLDAGNVFIQDQSIDLDDLRYSTGAGIRYLSPIGPIGFDVAHPIDEKPGEPSVRFHFSIGSTF